MKHKVKLQGVVAREMYLIMNKGVRMKYNTNPLSESLVEKVSSDWKGENSLNILTHYIPLEEKVIWEGELLQPIMNKGEIIKVVPLNEEFLIREVVRDTEDNYIYKTSKVVEVVRDEKTEISKADAIRYFEVKDSKKYCPVDTVPEEEVVIRENWFTRLFK